MDFLKSPNAIIIGLGLLVLFLVLAGVYFVLRATKASKGTEEKDFCSIVRIENSFEHARMAREARCVVYVSVSLDNINRIYSEVKSHDVYEQIKSALFKHLCLTAGGELSLYGAEGFVAFNRLEAGEIIQCIERCYEDIADILSKTEAVNVVRVNFGYHCTASTDVSFKTSLSRAKQACSIAEDKNALYCRWDTSNGKEFERKIKIENNIQSEIDNNRFFLEYQPILDAKTNSIVGAEVLSRLNSPTEGILTPKNFLSAVNSVGLSEKFDYYIFEKSCKWISNDKAGRLKYVYTVNFSRQTLCDRDLAEKLIAILEKYNVDCSSIAVEILEDKSLTAEESERLINNLKKLKEKGVLILLDDFGKGYTSFTNLTEFDIDIVKIDKSIVQGATTESGLLILKNIIKTAHELGFKTLCEGIETEQHKRLAIEADCDMFQGFYFYRPMPVTRFETLFN